MTALQVDATPSWSCWSTAATATRTRSSAPHPNDGERDRPGLQAAGQVRRVAASGPRTASASTSTTSTPASGSATCRSPTCPTTASRSTTARARSSRRRPLPLPAHPRRDGPAPDQRGPPRAAVDRARRAPCTATTAWRPGRRARRSPCGRPAPRACGSRATSTAGTAASTHAPARRVGRLGAVRARRRQRHEVQVPDPRRRRPVAREGRPDGLPHRGAPGDVVGRLRVVATPGATTSG